MKRSLVNLRRIIVLSFGLFIFLLLAAYFCIAQYYKGHFCAKTFINGVDCSNLTAEEAKDWITRKMASYTLCITTRDGETQRVAGDDIGVICTFEKEVQTTLQEQSPYGWLLNALRENHVESPCRITYEKEKLNTVVERLPCMKTELETPPVNARISAYNRKTGFSITKEQPGKKLNKQKAIKEIKTAVDQRKPTLSLDEAGCYEAPKITSKDQRLVTTLQKINKYMKTEITYTIGNQTEIFDGRNIGPAIKVDAKNQVTLDETVIEAFVEELNKKYSTVSQTRTFQTSYGKTVKIQGGDYGFKLDCKKEKEEILTCIKDGVKKTKGLGLSMISGKNGANDIGGTYVEINLAKQQLFVYYDGKNVIKSSLVSGSIKGGHATPTGVYQVQAKQRSRYLEGPDDDGSWYKSYVNYWMPFNGGIGLHDATWRHGKFGGTIYKTRGSHGCINLPLENAKTMYETIAKGTPVIVYELEDTK